MTELLPCPFCGGKPKLAMFGLVYCPDCGATIGIENWNTRMQAQEIVLDTTSLSNTFSLSDTLSIQGETYRRARTCFNASTRKDEMQFTCSECWLPVFISTVNNLKVFPNYCPHCGAKAVD